MKFTAVSERRQFASRQNDTLDAVIREGNSN